MSTSTARISVLAIAAALALAACGEPSSDLATDGETTTEETAPEPSPGDSETEGTADPPGPDDGSQDHGVGGIDPVPGDELPGEEFAMYFSDAGAVAHVVGVETGDVLFVRALPDASAEEVGRLAPTGEVVLAGRERALDPGFWAEVELSDGVGWVNTSYLGYVASPGEDITGEFPELGPYEYQEDLVVEAALHWAARGSEEGGPEIGYTVVETPSGDTPLYRVDIAPYADDAQRGERLEILLESGAEGYTLGEVRSFPICGRGTADGLCV